MVINIESDLLFKGIAFLFNRKDRLRRSLELKIARSEAGMKNRRLPF